MQANLDPATLDRATLNPARGSARGPPNADSIVAHGTALLEADQHAAAAALLTAACAQHPNDARIITLNGRALLALGRTGPAIGALFRALELRPGQAAAHFELALALFGAGDMAAALVQAMAAFKLDPSHDVTATLSGVLAKLGQFEPALAFADHALALRPQSVAGWQNRAIALRGLGRMGESLAAWRQAAAAAPGNADIKYALAATLLSLGHLTAEAWDLHEWRMPLKLLPALEVAAALPGITLWNGEDITGRTLLLHAEQGLGDTLQFVRFVPLVAGRAARVILAVQAPLLRLLQDVPGVDQVVQLGGSLPPFDVCCALMSLPRILGTGLGSIPPALPYVAMAPSPPGDGFAGLRVGLVWAGNAGFLGDRERSIDPAALALLAGLPHVRFYSLQRHEAGRPTAPIELGAIDLMAGVQDFADTAALVAGLDLVVAVDTAVAHLAATMGKPVWLLSRLLGCWRWLRDRDDSPWYPSLRIIRQTRFDDWSGPLQQVRRDIASLCRA